MLLIKPSLQSEAVKDSMSSKAVRTHELGRRRSASLPSQAFMAQAPAPQHFLGT